MARARCAPPPALQSLKKSIDGATVHDVLRCARDSNDLHFMSLITMTCMEHFVVVHIPCCVPLIIAAILRACNTCKLRHSVHGLLRVPASYLQAIDNAGLKTDIVGATSKTTSCMCMQVTSRPGFVISRNMDSSESGGVSRSSAPLETPPESM